MKEHHFSGGYLNDGHSGSHHGGSHSGHNDHDDERKRGRDSHDDERRDGVDEAIGRRLKQPARFDFEEVSRALGQGNGGRTMSAAEIARRWAEVQGYASCLSDCRDVDRSHDADIAQIRDLFGASSPHHGHCFGYEGSTGASHGPDKWLKTLQGLGEGSASFADRVVGWRKRSGPVPDLWCAAPFTRLRHPYSAL